MAKELKEELGRDIFVQPIEHKKRRMYRIFAGKFSTRKDAEELMEKVTWPTWAQLQQSTVIVLSAPLIIMALVWLMDLGSNELLKLIYSLFT